MFVCCLYKVARIPFLSSPCCMLCAVSEHQVEQVMRRRITFLLLIPLVLCASIKSVLLPCDDTAASSCSLCRARTRSNVAKSVPLFYCLCAHLIGKIKSLDNYLSVDVGYFIMLGTRYCYLIKLKTKEQKCCCLLWSVCFCFLLRRRSERKKARKKCFWCLICAYCGVCSSPIVPTITR